MAVEEADADEREAEVAGRLEVVAGEDAEAAGVLGQGLGDAELGREVGDRPQGAVGPALEPARPGSGSCQIGADRVEGPQERRVVDQLVEPLRADRAEQANGVVHDRIPLPGSTHRNSSRVCRSHDQRRFMARASRGARASGKLGRTVKLRRAFIGRDAIDVS